MVSQTMSDETEFDRAETLLDDLHEVLEDEYHRYDVRRAEEAPDGTVRAVVYIYPHGEEDAFESSTRRGSAKVTAINALPAGLEVEKISEGFDHFEVRLAEEESR